MRGYSQHEGLFLSLDVGTSGVKACLFTADGVCCGERSATVNILTPRPGWSELDLKRVWEEVVKISSDLVTSHEAGRRVVGIGLSASSPTVVAVDSTGRALSNGLTYADSRAQVRLDRIRKLVGDERYQRLTGNRLALALCSAAAMLHVADEVGASGPGGLRTGHLNSYLACRLTGRWVMDWTNASFTGLVNLRTPGEWSSEACEALEFPTRLLPELVAPWEPIGQLAAEAAAEFGLGRSVVVVAGAADTACSAYGVGCVNEGEVFESAGTSGVLTVCHARPLGSPLFLNRAHVVPGRWLSHGAMSAAGAAVRWLRDAIFTGVGSSEPDDYAWINAEAAKSVPGAGGVVFLPYLLGERTPVWDPDARGAWVGMSVGTGRHDLVRAVLESVGYGMRQMLEIEETKRGFEVEEVLIVGGGARNRFWTQMKADITGKRYRKAGEVESASRGAAMLATVGLGAHDDAWAASAAIGSPESEPVEPAADPAVREIYERRYRVFKGLYPTLRELFGDLRDRAWDRATEPGDGQDTMTGATGETGSATATCSVGAGGHGKQA
ncbi:MAG: FGGY-family carbohydrate kinase [Actinomycetota bacterium]|nr:FGGY-family carbohydrate kinase [Actinomycetota bacterium]